METATGTKLVGTVVQALSLVFLFVLKFPQLMTLFSRFSNNFFICSGSELPTLTHMKNPIFFVLKRREIPLVSFHH